VWVAHDDASPGRAVIASPFWGVVMGLLLFPVSTTWRSVPQAPVEGRLSVVERRKTPAAKLREAGVWNLPASAILRVSGTADRGGRQVRWNLEANTVTEIHPTPSGHPGRRLQKQLLQYRKQLWHLAAARGENLRTRCYLDEQVRKCTKLAEIEPAISRAFSILDTSPELVKAPFPPDGHKLRNSARQKTRTAQRLGPGLGLQLNVGELNARSIDPRKGTSEAGVLANLQDDRRLDKASAVLHLAGDKDLDVLCLTEIWDPSNAVVHFLQRDHHCVLALRETADKRGGVALLFRKSTLSLVSSQTGKRGPAEWARATVRTAGGALVTVTGVYIPPCGSVIGEDRILEPEAEDWDFLLHGSDILLGDLNASSPHWDGPMQESRRSTYYRGKSLLDATKRANALVANALDPKPTRFDDGGTSTSVLDLIIHGHHFFSSRPTVDRSALSDHGLVTATLTCGALPPSPKLRRPTINWRLAKATGKIAEFQEVLTGLLGQVRCKGSSNSRHKAFVRSCLIAAGLALPWTRGGGGWVPLEGVQDALDRCRRAWDLGDGQAQDVSRQKAAAAEFQRIAGAATVKALRAKDPFQLFKMFSPQEDRSEPALRAADTPSSPTLSRAGTADKFNKAVLQKHGADPILRPTRVEEPSTNRPSLNGSTNPPRVQLEELRRAIRKCRVNTCRDPDSLTVQMLKALPNSALEYLRSMFDSVYASGVVPIAWRSSVIVPIYKGKEELRHLPSGYRPVAITSLVSRLWERVTLLRMESQVVKRISPKQFGFLRSRSTSQITTMISRWMQEVFLRKTRVEEPNRPLHTHKSMVVSIDATDAFCKVNHPDIRRSLLEFQIPEYIILSVMAWTSARWIRTRVGPTLSDWGCPVTGIAQGSVLGPVLYIMATNELLELLDQRRESCGRVPTNRTMTQVLSDLAGYADDLELWGHSHSPEAAARGLSEWGTVATGWLSAHGIPVSNKSTANLQRPGTSTEPLASRVVLKAGQETITLPTKWEDLTILGVTFDKRGESKPSAAEAAQALRKVNRTLARLRYLLHPSQLRMLYLSFGIGKINHLLPALWEWAWRPEGHEGLALSRQPRQRTLVGFLAGVQAAVDLVHPLPAERVAPTPDHLLDLEQAHVEAARIICGTAMTAAQACCLREANLEPLHLLAHQRVMALEEKMVRGPPQLSNWVRNSTGVGHRRPILTCLPYTFPGLPPDASIARAAELSARVTFFTELGKDELGRTLSKLKLITTRAGRPVLQETERGSRERPSTSRGGARDDEIRNDIPSEFLTQERVRWQPPTYSIQNESALQVDNRNRLARAIELNGPPRLELWTDGGMRHLKESSHEVAAGIATYYDPGTELPVVEKFFPAGADVCSYTAESVASLEGLRWLLSEEGQSLFPHPGHLLWATDSKSLLEALQQGVLDQKDYLESQVWCQLLKLVDKGWDISAVFVFSHVGTTKNEYADRALTTFLSGVTTTSEVRNTTDGVWWKDVARLRHKLYCTSYWDESHAQKPHVGAVARAYGPKSHTQPILTLASKSVCLLAQLRSGVCARADVLYEQPVPCRNCGARVMRRGLKGVEHIFECRGHNDVLVEVRNSIFRDAIREGKSIDPRLLWTHPSQCIYYAEFYISGQYPPGGVADLEFPFSQGDEPNAGIPPPPPPAPRPNWV
jgi:ribonuclease HI